MTVTLTIIDGQLQGTSYNFDSRTFCWVGRMNNCTICFPQHPNYGQISRLHCLIDIDPPKISIRDFNSKHGTYVDDVLLGKRDQGQAAPAGTNIAIEPIEKNLYSGNIIGVGNAHIQVTISGPQPDYTPAPRPQTNLRQVADRAIAWLKNRLEITG